MLMNQGPGWLGRNLPKITQGVGGRAPGFHLQPDTDLETPPTTTTTLILGPWLHISTAPPRTGLEPSHPCRAPALGPCGAWLNEEKELHCRGRETEAGAVRVLHRAPRKFHAEALQLSRLGEERNQLADDIHRHPPSCQRRKACFGRFPCPLPHP